MLNEGPLYKRGDRIRVKETNAVFTVEEDMGPKVFPQIAVLGNDVLFSYDEVERVVDPPPSGDGRPGIRCKPLRPEHLPVCMELLEKYSLEEVHVLAQTLPHHFPAANAIWPTNTGIRSAATIKAFINSATWGNKNNKGTLIAYVAAALHSAVSEILLRVEARARENKQDLEALKVLLKDAGSRNATAVLAAMAGKPAPHTESEPPDDVTPRASDEESDAQSSAG